MSFQFAFFVFDVDASVRIEMVLGLPLDDKSLAIMTVK